MTSLTAPLFDALAQVAPLYQLVTEMVQTPVGDGQPFTFDVNDPLDFWKSMKTEVFVFGRLTESTPS